MNTKLPWRITEPNEKKTREIVANDGTTIAKLTKLDLELAGFIVAACNAPKFFVTDQAQELDTGYGKPADHSGNTTEKIDERALFEALELATDESGDYCNPFVQSAWEGFKAGIKSVLGVEKVDEKPWIKWSGGSCPVPEHALVDIKLNIGSEHKKQQAGEWHWTHGNLGGDIAFYRLS